MSQNRHPHALVSGKPEDLFKSEDPNRPGLVVNTQGTSWAGMINAQEIVENGGRTYGDTDIDLSNTDTQNRVNKAKEVLNEKSFYQMSIVEQMILMDQFARRIHQDDVVGSYFPEVRQVRAQIDNLINEGVNRVLSEDQLKEIQALRASQVARNNSAWSRRDQNGVVENDSIIEIEETNEETTLAVLEIQKQAAYEVLGFDRAQEIEQESLRGISNLSTEDVERRVVTALLHEAGQEKLTEEERSELSALGQREDQLWQEKHNSQSDFADAIRDGSPDCSEYASLSAVSFAQSQINSVRVMGHVLHDDDFPMVGAHAYNVILDESGQNVIGVFEGTATSGSFKQVTNNVSYEDFQNGTTLVTYSSESGWSTYGTGSPAQGRDLLDFVDNPDVPGQKDLVTNIIEARDVSAIGAAKSEFVRNLSPDAVADQIIDLYEQYGDTIKVQGWIDGIRDGNYPSDTSNPAFAQAAQLLHDYNGEMPPPMDIRDRLIRVVQDAQQRAIATGDYDIAITPEVLHELDGPASASLADDLKQIVDRLSPEQIQELSQTAPWMTEVAHLADQIGDTSYRESLRQATREGDHEKSDLYAQIGSIVRAHNISEQAVDALQDLSSTPAAQVHHGYTPATLGD